MREGRRLAMPGKDETRPCTSRPNTLRPFSGRSFTRFASTTPPASAWCVSTSAASAVAKASLKAGESRRIEVTLRPSAFSFCDDAAGKWRAEAARYEIRVGTSSRDIRLRAAIGQAADRAFERF
jgi:hypothetical protein